MFGKNRTKLPCSKLMTRTCQISSRQQRPQLTTDSTNCSLIMEVRPKNGKLSPMRLGGSTCCGRIANTLSRNRVEQCLRECNNSHYLKAAGVGAAGLGGDGRPVQNRPIGVTSGLGVELRGWEAENPSRNPSASA